MQTGHFRSDIRIRMNEQFTIPEDIFPLAQSWRIALVQKSSDGTQRWYTETMPGSLVAYSKHAMQFFSEGAAAAQASRLPAHPWGTWQARAYG
jgi:hypothetical protein